MSELNIVASHDIASALANDGLTVKSDPTIPRTTYEKVAEAAIDQDKSNFTENDKTVDSDNDQLSSGPNLEIIDPENDQVPSQVNPEFKDTETDQIASAVNLEIKHTENDQFVSSFREGLTANLDNVAFASDQSQIDVDFLQQSINKSKIEDNVKPLSETYLVTIQESDIEQPLEKVTESVAVVPVRVADKIDDTIRTSLLVEHNENTELCKTMPLENKNQILFKDINALETDEPELNKVLFDDQSNLDLGSTIIKTIEKKLPKSNLKLWNNKDYMGGHIIKDIEYFHATAQTTTAHEKRHLKTLGMIRYHRDTQTVQTKKNGAQTVKLKHTQVTKNDCYVTTETDRFIQSGYYTDSVEHAEILFTCARTIQCCIRQTLSRMHVNCLRNARATYLQNKAEVTA